MLARVSKLRHYSIRALDGAIGGVVNVFFDDQTWTVRYFVVETGDWLRRRRVLISPIAVTAVDEGAHTVTMELTRSQIAGSPRVETDMPLSRQMELKYRDYFSWPLYWTDTYLRAYGAGIQSHRPRVVVNKPRVSREVRREPLLKRMPNIDPHLRSAGKVIGYAVIGSDLPAGRLDDVIIDSSGWAIRSLIVHADAAPHARVLLDPRLVVEIKWPTSSIIVRASRKEVASLPTYQAGDVGHVTLHRS
ncbi:MAG: PRC-barrel domain containing protein [Dehalococcoidia bacterium]|nr:MAG: PRC-barrel domain containing protein [Dehalococcoidia bacterium]